MYKNLKDFYDSIENPFSCDDSYRNLVELYSDVSNYKFSIALPYLDKKTKKNNDIFMKNINEYYVYLFYLWKERILGIGDNVFDYLKDGNKSLKEIKILQDYLRCLPTPRNSSDVFEFMNPDSIKIMDIIKKYGFDKYEFDKWNYITSDIFYNHLTPSFPTEHFLAVNTDFCDTLPFCINFQNMCRQKNLPFSYSFYLGDDSLEKVIIQTDTAHLLDYLKILDEMKELFPSIVNRCGDLSIFTGKVNEFVGYGSQEGNYDNNFYSVRTNHLKSCTEFILFEFLKRNYKKKIKGKRYSIFLIDYLTSIITLNYIEYLKTSYGRDFTNLKSEKIDSKKLYNHIAKYVKANLIKQLEKSSGLNDLKDFNVYYRNIDGRSIFKFKKEFLYRVIRENAIEIFDSNPSLYSTLKRAITKSAKTYGIDDKYCFNSDVVKKLNDDSYSDTDIKRLYLSE